MMLKLIRLELRKNNIRPYCIAAACILLVSFAFCFLTAVIPKLEAPGSVDLSEELTMFIQWSGFIQLISVLIFTSFGVLSAVMHARFTVEEYAGKRSLLLFSYPVKRGKVLFAKCGMVFVFTAVCNAVCSLAVLSGFGMLSNALSILPEQFTADTFSLLLKTTAICSLLSASVGLVALRIGFWRRSLVATIVTAFVLVIPFGNLTSLFPDSSALVLLVGMLVLLAAGLFIFFHLLSRVNKMEAL